MVMRRPTLKGTALLFLAAALVVGPPLAVSLLSDTDVTQIAEPEKNGNIKRQDRRERRTGEGPPAETPGDLGGGIVAPSAERWITSTLSQAPAPGGSTEFRKETPGLATMVLRPRLVAEDAAEPLVLQGLELCYDSIDPGVEPDTLTVSTRSSGSRPRAASLTVTNLSDTQTCQSFTGFQPRAPQIGPSDNVTVQLTADWTVGDSPLLVGPVNFLLEQGP